MNDIDKLLASLPDLTELMQAGSSSERWTVAFTEHPDAMNRLLADYIKQVYATPGRVGQRPMPRQEQVDLDAILYGHMTDQPITKALPPLIKPSLRSFADRLHMSRTQLQRVLDGIYQPTIVEIHNIADAAGVPAVYFREYREGMVVAAVLHMLRERPGLAADIYRTYLNVVPPKSRKRR